MKRELGHACRPPAGRAGQAGFTLIELLIVMAVMSVLVGALLTIVSPLTQFEKARDGRRKADLSSIQKALEEYYQDRGRYPGSSDFKVTSDDANNPVVEWGQQWQPYMNILPQDSGSTTYVYFSDSGQEYRLYASLERGGDDPDACFQAEDIADTQCQNVPEGATCGNVCNYGVTSPNSSP